MLLLQLMQSWNRLKNKVFTTIVGRSFKAFGTGSSLWLPINLSGIDHITVGDDVLVWPDTIIQSHLGGEIVIGSRVEIYERAVITAQSSVVIEDGVGIGRNAHISDHSHTYDDPALDFVDQPGTVPAPVLIKQGAWIANGVIVMPGVTIGKRAVIGAGATVTKDVPDYAVAIGSPARVVKVYAPGELQVERG